MKDFFISYNKADEAWAVWIAWQLDEAGYGTLIQAWDFGGGANFAYEMHQAAMQTEHTVLVLSPDFLSSEFCNSEWTAAFVQDPTARKRRLLPVRIRDCKPPGQLAALDYVDLVGKEESVAREALLGWIQNALTIARGGRAKPSRPPDFPGVRTHAHKPQFPGDDQARTTSPAVADTPGAFTFDGLSPLRLKEVVASRSPIIAALEEADEPLDDAELLRTERHMTITFTAEQAKALERLSSSVSDHRKSISDLMSKGTCVWDILESAQPRLRALLEGAKRSKNPQPIAWTGRTDFLVRIHRALLMARFGDVDGAEGFLSVGFGGHYFNPLSTRSSQWGMQRRSEGPIRVKALAFEADTQDPQAEMTGACGFEAVLLSAPSVTAKLQSLVEVMSSQRNSVTRVAIGFGQTDLSAEFLHATLARLPCVSLGGTGLQNPSLIKALAQVFPVLASRQAVPCLLSAFRQQWLRLALEADNASAFQDGIWWTTWSWIGRPLFAGDFGEVVPAAYPHLMDLRSVASKEWYFNRRKNIHESYQAESLVRSDAAPGEKFHFYLSGAGGTGKSCFLRFVYEQLVNRPNVLAVWYRIDAPSSEWDDVETRIKQEIVAAATQKLRDKSGELLPPGDIKLSQFLTQLVRKLREADSDVNEVVVFIDQLERTFESGDQPEFHRLENISFEVVELLKTVGVGKGVRLYIASRKQYLPDFLRSFSDASECGLHFNVLQSISDRQEQIGFVERVLRWCKQQELVDDSVQIDRQAAESLAGKKGIEGHPLNMMLALIQVFSQGPKGKITEEIVTASRPWEKLFGFDEQVAAKDDLAWFFLLAMSHARTEIVRSEEVLWRLRLVRPTLTRGVDDLGPKGVLEWLWLRGHLGRTIHARPFGKDPARFLEFFHANLRDHLLRDVMNYGSAELRIPGRSGGTPPVWRALDRLSAAAHDWEQTQQLLPWEDIRVLMEHRLVVVERIKQENEPERDVFYLLFLRDAEASQSKLCQAAKECFVFSALIHDEFGRWAFEQVFPDIAARIECCERWLQRSSSDSRVRILQYLIELEVPDARRFMARLVLAGLGAGQAEVWREIADILAEPLYAARYRSEAIMHLLEAAVNEAKGAADGPEALPTRFGEFVAAACGGNRNELLHLLSHCADRVEGSQNERLRRVATQLRSGDFADACLGKVETHTGLNTAFNARELHGKTPPKLQLVVGRMLEKRISSDLAERWRGAISERLGIPVPPVELASGEVESQELELRLSGQRVAIGDFHPPLCQILKRHWDRTQSFAPTEVILSQNEALQEVVLWLDRDYLRQFAWELPVWEWDAAILNWLEEELRKNLDDVFDYDHLVAFIREISSETEVGQLFRSVSLPVLRRVIVNLVHERVPLRNRRTDLVEELQQLVVQVDNTDDLTQKLRESLAPELCRGFAGAADQLALITLEDGLERYLVNRLSRPSEGSRALRLDPAQALALASAIRRHVERCLRDDDMLPVVMTSAPVLRLPLFRLLERFDPRIHVLSITELLSEVPWIDAGRVTEQHVLRTDR